jgi:hypothetical protein
MSDKDYFKLFNKNNVVQGDKVVKLLKYKKQDVAAATNVSLNSIRYEEERIPAELRERLTEWAIALNLVAGFFNDLDKTILWFSTPNPLLGNISPRDMIRIGRSKKLLNFIQTALNENSRDMSDERQK